MRRNRRASSASSGVRPARTSTTSRSCDAAFDGHLRLFEDFARDGGFVVRHDSARIHDFERPALPRRRAVDAVARDSRLVGDNRAPSAGQPVENRGLAHIGAADNHH